jgi:HAD superfamily hydrolase (TIGR01662 family)
VSGSAATRATADRWRVGPPVAAIFFDVDFTLIYPGPTFQGEGYQRFCAEHGIDVDVTRFDAAVRAASSILDAQQDHVYEHDVFVRYVRRIIEHLGGGGPRLDECARRIYDEWAACQHFFLYDDVPDALRALAARGLKLGLISNSHRCLVSFQQHFELEGLIAAAISSAEHGYMKPHPSIFGTALNLAGVSAEESVMVGDSLTHDIAGAMSAGMRGVLVHRSDAPIDTPADVPVIRSLSELPALIDGLEGRPATGPA